MPPYDDDLAAIHEAGFGDVAEAAAGALLDLVGEKGRVVELGCGPGLAARRFVDAGCDVLGYDLSPAMIALARRRVPEGEFRAASFVDSAIPPCIAVAAFGEVLNYAFDPANGDAARRELFIRVRSALAPGGLFLFDLAGPDRAPDGSRQAFREDDGWAVLAESRADADRRILTRRIVTFRREPDDRYRRAEETHRQLLVEPGSVRRELEAAGFEVETADRYGELVLPAGLTVFRARAVRGPVVSLGG